MVHALISDTWTDLAAVGSFIGLLMSVAAIAWKGSAALSALQARDDALEHTTEALQDSTRNLASTVESLSTTVEVLKTLVNERTRQGGIQ